MSEVSLCQFDTMLVKPSAKESINCYTTWVVRLSSWTLQVEYVCQKCEDEKNDIWNLLGIPDNRNRYGNNTAALTIAEYIRDSQKIFISEHVSYDRFPRIAMWNVCTHQLHVHVTRTHTGVSALVCVSVYADVWTRAIFQRSYHTDASLDYVLSVTVKLHLNGSAYLSDRRPNIFYYTRYVIFTCLYY